MKIALIGYGKMGQAIERHAIARGHEITAIIDINNSEDFHSPEFINADVAIEFTTPAAAIENYRRAFSAGIPVVSGTTGWTDRSAEVDELIAKTGATLFWTSNFSIGVNIFMAVNRYLARLMAQFTQYTPSMKEIHHIHKLDHPSGTAITLAEGIIAENTRISAWTEAEDTTEDTIHIDHERQGEVPGTHIIRWKSAIDELTIEHQALSRDGFALGAVLAAEWLHTSGRTGRLSMPDMLPF